MIKYILKRLLLSFFILFVIITITFFLMNMIPGGPFSGDKSIDPEVKLALMKKFNLDKPLIVQYVLYLKNILHGDFGISIKTRRPVLDVIFSSFAISFKIGILAILLALLVGIVLGVLCALYKDTIVDRIIVIISTIIVSVPSFVIGSTLLLIFCVQLKWFPVWTQEGGHLLLPVLSMSFSPIAVIIKYVRSSMLEVMGENYIKTARAKGVPETKVVFVHALRNAILPIITYLGPLTAGLITGSVVIEKIFTIGGLGSEFLTCIDNKDYPMILGVTIFFSALIVFTNLLSDILYKVVDPRIKFD